MNANDCILFFSFFKVFGGHMSFFGATGTPVLDFWWCLLWDSKPEWVLPYSLFVDGECNIHSPRSTSGATLANLLAAGAQPVLNPHILLQRWGCRDSNSCYSDISVSQTLLPTEHETRTGYDCILKYMVLHKNVKLVLIWDIVKVILGLATCASPYKP